MDVLTVLFIKTGIIIELNLIELEARIAVNVSIDSLEAVLVVRHWAQQRDCLLA